MEITHYCGIFQQPVRIQKKAKKPISAFPQKNMILLFPWGGYGDILMTTAILKILRQFNQQTKIYCYNREKMQGILQHNPMIDRFIPFPHGLFPKEKLQEAINNPEADPMIFYSAYGYFKPTHSTPQRHAISLIGDMVGVKGECDNMSVDFSEAEIDFARRTKKELGKPFILMQINPLSHPGKAWFIDRWAEVVRFLNSQGMAAIQVGYANEKPIPGAVNFLGNTTILQALALLTEASFFLGIDSVFQHAAHALRVPALVLFGSSTPAIWGYPNHISLYKNLPCQPCVAEFPYTCQERRCMLEISPDEVIDEARKLI